ncbi:MULTISPECIES: hypothetical protein [unclassified Coleofasciculus]|uniref:hypothetical protein n=1 Tax=unclassified Coleofasciculus TaxID=2692782 RepID=UPI001882BA5F|nr:MULTISPECIES: hypothetical protein [unclassified Coleofasciculus]MBE9125672.1 hypothetical protein [Coleofasciculus sp. LEGE 07081]MBE9148827.1 hypothetical protein [Coleofasciculus sp. LEGE 07092]
MSSNFIQSRVSRLPLSQKVLLKSQYRTLGLVTEDKFETWLMTLEERWASEVVACLQGKFPDWRG